MAKIGKFRITSAYGWRTHPITGKRSFHAGIDLVKGHKQQINAFVSGTVLFAGKAKSGTGLGGYGNVVVIKDSKGHAHVYAHLDSVFTRKGKKVRAGERIGTQGATGNVTGSHLHYEVRKKSSPSYGWTNKAQNSTINPKPFISNKGGGRMVKKIAVDGYLGKETIKRLQQFFGTPQDGKLSKPSLVIKELQKFLNTYGQ